MATTLQNATVSTRIESTEDGYRVVYDTPAGGFSADERDALEFAIAIAERKIAELVELRAPLELDPLAIQHDRMAAPC